VKGQGPKLKEGVRPVLLHSPRLPIRNNDPTGNIPKEEMDHRFGLRHSGNRSVRNRLYDQRLDQFDIKTETLSDFELSALRAPGKNQEKSLTDFRQNLSIPIRTGF
jgi:hypothetical protein